MGDWAQVQMNTSKSKASGSPARPKGVVIPALIPAKVEAPECIPISMHSDGVPVAGVTNATPAPVDTTLLPAPQTPFLPAPVPLPPPVIIPLFEDLCEAEQKKVIQARIENDPRIEEIVQARKEERKQKLLERQEKFQDDMLGKKLRQTIAEITTEQTPARSRSPNRISKAGSFGAASSSNP
jgi:hypothetical protein